MRLQWDFDAWEDYCYWQRTDPSMLKRINELIKHNLSGFWSRRINDGNRLVYAIEKDAVVIISCKGHYGSK